LHCIDFGQSEARRIYFGFLQMLSPPIIGLIAFTIILAGAFGGWAARQRLPEHHLSDETKSLVTVSMAVVGTISALVLGLLISNANTSFITRSGEITALSADILRLDQMMRLYGPETDPARGKLRQYAERKTNDLFSQDPRDIRVDNPATYEVLQQAEELLLELRPADPRRRWLLDQALAHATKIGNTRWLLAQQTEQGTPKIFVALVVFWLALLFASFGLFAPRNFISALVLVLCAVAVSGAVEMVLELEQPFGGVLRVSALPMREAVGRLNASLAFVWP
jgi:hypothetical protein